MQILELEQLIKESQNAWIGRKGEGFVLGTGNRKIYTNSNDARLEDFPWGESTDFVGFLNYDLKNQFEDLSPPKHGMQNFPLFAFFPLEQQVPLEMPAPGILNQEVSVRPHLSREEYLQQAEKLLHHIQRGDIYEVNFCIPFSGTGKINPLNTFLRLYELSPMPHAAFLKLGENYILCASPERFLKKEGNRLFSQPMKGTIARNGSGDEEEIKNRLQNDPKERAENIMITDLVRNDLSRVATRGSVKVEELCAVYPYPGLFQMISTVSCNLNKDTSLADILKATFPMGSMTGAPKVSAMELITETEPFARGPFSGSIGWFQKNGDFDTNVLIRSIFYNENSQSISFSAGSALTANCDPEREYEECMLKAKKLIQVLSE